MIDLGPVVELNTELAAINARGQISGTLFQTPKGPGHRAVLWQLAICKMPGGIFCRPPSL
jgi:hypothetical protein